MKHLLWFLVLLCPMTSWAQSPPELTARLLDSWVEQGKIPGYYYAWIGPEGVLWERWGGLADLSNQRNVERETGWAFASCTKPVTAWLVLTLATEQGTSLDEPIQKWLPQVPLDQPVTLRQLLTHSAGIANPLPLNWLYPLAPPIDRKALIYGELKSRKLDFEPGSDYGYSNLGYGLLGLWIEAVSGKTYDQVIHERLFETAGLDLGTSPSAQEAVGYQKTGIFNWLIHWMAPERIFGPQVDGWQSFVPLQHMHPAYGGLRGSGPALAQWLSHWLRADSTLIPPDLIAQAFAQQSTNTGEALPVSLAWHLGKLNGVPWYGKPGGGPGFFANLRLYPSLSRASLLLVNQTRISPSSIHQASDQLDELNLP